MTRRYPTDLDDDETALARQRMVELADRMTAEGDLRSPRWREAFLDTWRHPYVPAYYPSLHEPPVLCVDSARRAVWLDAVYSNTTLVTKVAPIPLSRAFRPATGWMHVSSSTLPGLVLRMLEALDVQDEDRVLEIGTGSGYTCALLCQRLGDAKVTSVDIDGELVDLAAERLAANGYRPTLAVADGASGHPDGGPYSSVVATCGVRAVPSVWFDQLIPGGVVLTDLHGDLGGAVVRLIFDSGGAATGRFLPRWAGFMGMRPTVDPVAPAPHTWTDTEQIRSTSAVDPAPLLREGEMLGFLAQWHLPGVRRSAGASDDGRPALHLWGDDGSEAVVETDRVDGTHRVAESGPRRLWRAVEEAHGLWEMTGRPGYDRFGVSVNGREQYVWLDDPDGPHRWPIVG